MPVAPELSAKYELSVLLPTGTLATAVFNDPSDANYVGTLTDHSGFDSPEIREESENRPATDGGLHGVFFFGRRLLTLTGKVLNPASVNDRSTRLERLQRVVLNMLKRDGTLKWTLADGTVLFCAVRCQQPLRVEGAWQKQFQIALAAADPRLYGATVQFYGGQSGVGGTSVPASSLTNTGTADTYLSGVITIPAGRTGPLTITNSTTGETLTAYSTGAALPAQITYDFGAQTLRNTAAGAPGIDVTSEIIYPTSSWWKLQSGTNSVVVSTGNSTTAVLAATFNWRNAWW